MVSAAFVQSLTRQVEHSCQKRAPSGALFLLAFRSILQHKRHHHVDLPSGDLAVLDGDLVFLDPGTGHAAQGFGGAGDALRHGIFKAFGRGGRKFGYASNGHVLNPVMRVVDARA